MPVLPLPVPPVPSHSSDRLPSSPGAVEAEALFHRLYEASVDRCHAVALQTLRNHAHAEEVVQEAYADVWQSLGRFDPERGSALAWVLTIVHRRAVDRVRATVAQQRRDSGHHDQDHATAHDSTAEEAVRAVQAVRDGSRVRDALATLVPDQRRAVELAYLGGYSHSEVAERTGVPLGTAKSRIRQGLRLLRARLEETSAVASA